MLNLKNVVLLTGNFVTPTGRITITLLLFITVMLILLSIPGIVNYFFRGYGIYGYPKFSLISLFLGIFFLIVSILVFVIFKEPYYSVKVQNDKISESPIIEKKITKDEYDFIKRLKENDSLGEKPTDDQIKKIKYILQK